jgi:hypothetical protein
MRDFHCVLLQLVQKHASICSVYTGRVAQSVYGLATAWTVRRSTPVGGEIFRACPDRPFFFSHAFILSYIHYYMGLFSHYRLRMSAVSRVR